MRCTCMYMYKCSSYQCNYVYVLHTSPHHTHHESSEVLRFKRSDAIEIRDGIKSRILPRMATYVMIACSESLMLESV